jgi:hypothetical protein
MDTQVNRATELEIWAMQTGIPTLRSIKRNAAHHMKNSDTNEDRKRFEALHHRASQALEAMPKGDQNGTESAV